MLLVRLDLQDHIICLQILAGAIEDGKQTYIISLGKVQNFGVKKIICFLLIEIGSKIGINI